MRLGDPKEPSGARRTFVHYHHDVPSLDPVLVWGGVCVGVYVSGVKFLFSG